MPPANSNANAAPRLDLNFGVILQGLILGALLWVGTSINTLNAQMSAVQVQVGDLADLKKRVGALELDAVRLNAQVTANTGRVSRLEGGR